MASKRCGIDDVAGLGESRDRPWGIVAVAFLPLAEACREMHPRLLCSRPLRRARQGRFRHRTVSEWWPGNIKSRDRLDAERSRYDVLSKPPAAFGPRPTAVLVTGFRTLQRYEIASTRDCHSATISNAQVRAGVKGAFFADRAVYAPRPRRLRRPATVRPHRPPFGNEPRPRPAPPIYCR